ncbi:MAG: hypothetical protein R3300_19555, partial [Candidatus Promineifilaceae bacterium]|nr:hypothetical protein [Candidatus Promineifilaceae bacterium]
MIADLNHGLNINAILLGTPAAYTTSATPEMSSPVGQLSGAVELNDIQAATPVGLYAPVFCGNPDNCSDMPGANRSINPDNKWARFVFAAVDRYRPGGKLGQALGWSADRGVTHWAMWNEPDLPSFWDSSLTDYARLLKVGYLAAKHADPDASVLFGALANALPEQYNFYSEVLGIFAADPMGPQHDYYHDILATHNYSESWQSWWHVYRAGQTMINFGIDKPIWLDESGVPVWNDYPGPEWDPDSQYRATLTEQADFVVQSAFYAIYAGADAIYHFQLYDGCGNQPYGTDFPDDIEERKALCESGQVCHGDAHGLFRNPTDAACFSHHSQADTARPNYEAFKLVVTELQNVEPYWRLRPGGETIYTGPQEWIALYRTSTRERIIGLWARYGESETAMVPAVSASATLHYPDGAKEVIYPVNGLYTVELAPATNQNYPSYIDPSE